MRQEGEFMQKNTSSPFLGIRRAFLTLPNEELLLVTRKHWFILAQNLIILLLISVLLLSVGVYLSLFLLSSPQLFIASVLFAVLFFLIFSAKTFGSWFFHLYVVTDKKLIETHFDPLTCADVNDVLLTQVKCTEIDVTMHGFLEEMINMGNVTVTFDRPTHQEEFLLSHVKNPKYIESVLSKRLIRTRTIEDDSTIWYRRRDKNKSFRFTEELFPEVTT